MFGTLPWHVLNAVKRPFGRDHNSRLDHLAEKIFTIALISTDRLAVQEKLSPQRRLRVFLEFVYVLAISAPTVRLIEASPSCIGPDLSRRLLLRCAHLTIERPQLRTALPASTSKRATLMSTMLTSLEDRMQVYLACPYFRVVKGKPPEKAIAHNFGSFLSRAACQGYELRLISYGAKALVAAIAYLKQS